ncbi:MIF4G domain-containing protein [Sarocladium implicatum]|nr:MIF4G domain-containing protein [Sarocladium implicatum]
MTSPANQQNPIPATNSSATTASYASAAGAPKQPSQAPLVATGSQAPVVVGSSASPAQNANRTSTSPVNGKPSVTPAVPAVARGSAPNGSSDHARKSSVTMAANGPNSYVANGGPVGGAKSGIQFGFESSPAPSHSTPQTGSAAPIPIPSGNQGSVPSPAASPAPIPQPSASGGPPRSGLQQPGGPMVFGSLGSDGERHMRQGSAPPNPNAMGQPQPHGTHFRRESGHSVSGENQGRGGFVPQGGRGGRGYTPHGGNQYNNQMGYPPNNQFRNGPGQGRGMPPAFQPQPRNMGYPSSPQPSRVQPSGSMPGTPNMQPANMQPNMHMQTPPQYHYPPPMGPQHQQVQYPFFPSTKSSNKKHKKPKNYSKNARQEQRLADDAPDIPGDFSAHTLQEVDLRPLNTVTVNSTDNAYTISHAPGPTKLSQVTAAVVSSPPNIPISFDLSPASGQFEQLLTMKSQNYGYPPQQDGYGRPMSMQYGGYNMPYMGGPPQANSPSFNQQFAQPYHQSGHSMSRTPSQPERPSSANQPNQPMVVSSTPQPQNAQQKPAGTSFVKPRKSAAIQIKNAQGEVVDTSSFKAPTSPAPTAQASKTPPVAASTPTPPPKSATPSHTRTESQQPSKTAKEIQEELRNKIKAATAESSEDNASSSEPKEPVTEKPAPVATSTPAKQEAPATTEAPKDAEAAPKAEEPKAEAEAEKPAETEEEEMERMIREMEEEDARREAEAEEFNKKKAAAKAAAKAEEEKNRPSAAEEDAKLREQEREMERLEEEKERKRAEGAKAPSVAEALAAARAGKELPEEPKVDDVADKLAGMKIDGDKAAADAKPTTAEKRGAKPQRLDLAPLNTKPVEPPQPSAALQSLKSARFLTVMGQDIYPAGISSPNPALNAAVAKKGKTFHYDANFLLQFQKVFTEKPSIEFDQQIKTLMGDGEGKAGSARAQTPGSARAQSGRGGNAFPSMGSFNNTSIGGRTLPAGTSSKERFAISQGTMSRPSVNPMASFRGPGGGAFPGSSSMSRTPSQSNNPNSPRQLSQRTRGSSRRGGFDAKEAQAAKTMPLTAGMELKPIAVTATGWKPNSIVNKAAANAGAGGYMEPEMVQRKVKAALNKMTPEKFDRIADQILEIASQSKDESDGRTLRQVIQLTFEKATDEAHWASMYAKFCKRMLETISPDVRDEGIKDKNGQVVSGGNLFRKYLLNRCQEEFENGWVSKKEEADAAEGEAKAEAAEKEKEGEKKLGDTTLMSDEYYAAAAAKRRGLGLVQFIGELFKLGMLTERIMHQCVHRLVDYKGVPDEAEIESLCKLLRTIGFNLDQSERGSGMMNAYFARIQQAIDMPELPSRMKFMLMDVVDLRKAGWQSKDGNKGPKTLEEVRAEAEAAQAAKAQENARNNQRGGGRPPAGRGDARNFSAGYQQQNNNQVGLDDLRRLKGSASRTSSQNVTLGPTSMFSSRSNSGRRMGPGGSLGRPGEDSGASSRTGTPPTRENTSRSNTFGLLATMGDEDPTSPPSTAASPAVSKAVPDSDKKAGE